MLLSHRKRFLYSKTFKTAGTSVESFFERWCMPEGEWTFAHARDEYVSNAGIIGYRGPEPAGGRRWWGHMTAAEIRERAGAAIFDAYFKFCVVRNPFDKAVSAFHFLAGRAGLEAQL